MAMVVVLALAYGSLIPFDFEWSDAVSASGGVLQACVDTLCSPRWVGAHAGRSSLGVSFATSDLVANLLLYLPLGVTLRMAMRARKVGPAKQWLVCVSAAFALSWSLESLQGLMPSRTGSLTDVSANVLGAVAGAAVAPWLWRLYKASAFAMYCRMNALTDRLRNLAHRPGVAIALAVVNAAAIGLWYLLEVRRAFGDSSSETGASLPFEKAFNLPYDMGAVMLGQAMLAYAGVACLLMLLTYTGTRRLAMNWVVLGIVLIAFAAELSRALTNNTAPDITGPLLALTAGAFMTVTVYTFSFAVRRANRRHREQQYDGPERRRRPYDYA